ncbi:alpha/beta hydrolase [Micromonospora sp. NPDC000207]|uniref:alpha/beta hydrolase family protein n=1 Tax=Micromonospora sp. NPDC000207 TaxID=3154246 RepID=UPI00332FDE7D
MGAKRLIAVVLLSALVSGCGAATVTPGDSPTPIRAPERAYAVGVRTLTLDPGSARPLPVTVWFPAEGTEVADGRFPVVLYSHGLRSLPELHAALTTRWAAAGFVVAAPTYPHTNRHAARFSREDVRHQPADGWRVIRHLVRLDARRDDPLAGHLDVRRVAAAGHSAGGFTTAGMFSAGHHPRLRSGIVIAGGARVGGFTGPDRPTLFVHGSADPIVTASVGRAAYQRVRGPSAFLSLLGQGHGEYLTPGRPGFSQVLATTTDFLRWTLYGDAAAGRRIPGDARLPGVTAFDDRLDLPVAPPAPPGRTPS